MGWLDPTPETPTPESGIPAHFGVFKSETSETILSQNKPD
jgi:hypothetical protein